ncbi:MAG: amino acid permease, partial [Candidatus Marinimicrobia bacterium]|nr:amino acid permease [Candidatus Neomarinimicrobiota bacterium]
AYFGRGSGPSNEPRRAILLTFAISSAGIFAGDLNTIASVITMFFLMTYGTVNLACFYEMISRNPSFRPSFKMNHWSLALLGALGCLAVMFLISPVWALVAIVLSIGLYYLIIRSEIIVQWGDMSSGLAYQNARKALLRLEYEKYHPKNWRPTILALSGGAWNRSNLIRYACLFSADRGIVSLAQIITGELEDRFTRRTEAERFMRKFLRENNLPAFPVVIVDDSFDSALKALLQCHGIGGLRPNTLLLGWSGEEKGSDVFCMILDLARNMKRSVLVVRSLQSQNEWHLLKGTINIWWNDPVHCQLALLMAFLLQQNREWRDDPLRIIRTVSPKADLANSRQEMERMLTLSRIDAEILILPTDDALTALRDSIEPSAILFAGFDPPGPEEECREEKREEMAAIMRLPGEVVLVYNASDASLME